MKFPEYTDDAYWTDVIEQYSLITAQLCRDLYKDELSFCWAIHNGLYKNRQATNTSYSIYEVARLINTCKTKRHFRVLTYNFDDYLEEYLHEQSVHTISATRSRMVFIL